ncbi:MAG: methylmalonyl Co-A mutase-associated GTPase MeaB [Acidimicrobiia bacterium]|nr:methylmalonyl Co-A mutase-associated GTPase MeaB [Acidimicrobiia bacterium]
MTDTLDIADTLVAGIEAGERRVLARLITLLESTRTDHRATATAALDRLLPRTGGAVRCGLSGPPGVGKSTFVEALGRRLTGAGQTVAVLAVDASSRRSGGSILGDKTRMPTLARDPHAFIRPSPASATLGGVARGTRDAVLACEAFGFDVVLVETVGVGQSEVAVADVVDTFVLLVAAGAGDELQGIKRGIMELADVVAVTKADGEQVAAADRAVADHRVAVHLLRRRHPGWEPPVLACSAVTGGGIAEVWAAATAHHALLAGDGTLDRRRAEQATAALWAEVRDRLVGDLLDHPAVVAARPDVESRVDAGELTPTGAADELLRAFRGA